MMRIKSKKDTGLITYDLKGSYFPIMIKEIKELMDNPMLTMGKKVKVTHLNEEVIFTFDSKTPHALVAIGIQSNIFYPVQCDKKGVVLTLKEILSMYWEYGEKKCGPYYKKTLFPDDDDDTIDKMMKEATTEKQDEKEVEVENEVEHEEDVDQERAVEGLVELHQTPLREGMGVRRALKTKKKPPAKKSTHLDPQIVKLKSLIGLLTAHNVKVEETFEDSFEIKEDVDILTYLWKNYGNRIPLNKEESIKTVEELKNATLAAFENFVLQLFSVKKNNILEERANSFIKKVSKDFKFEFYRFCFELVCIYGVDGGQLCDIFGFMEDSFKPRILEGIQTIETLQNNQTDIARSKWFRNIKEKWLNSYFEEEEENENDMQIFAKLPWTTTMYSQFIEKFSINQNNVNAVQDKLHTILVLDRVSHAQVLKLIAKSDDFDKFYKNANDFKTVFKIYKLFYFSEAYDSFERYFALLKSELKDIRFVSRIYTAFNYAAKKFLEGVRRAKKRKKVVVRENLTELYAVLSTHCVQFRMTEQCCPQFVNKVVTLLDYSDQNLLNTFQEKIINKVFDNRKLTVDTEDLTENDICKLLPSLSSDKKTQEALLIEYEIFDRILARSEFLVTKKQLQKSVIFKNNRDNFALLSKIHGVSDEDHYLRLASLAAIFDAASLSKRPVQILSILYMLFHSKMNSISEKRKKKNRIKGILARIFTGEGKSLIVAIIAAFHVNFYKKKVDIFTSTPELVPQALNDFKDFYSRLNIKVGQLTEKKRDKSDVDILYTTAPLLIKEELSNRTLERKLKGKYERVSEVVILDEVDNLLYDKSTSIIQLSSDNTTALSPFLDIILINVYFKVKQGFIQFGSESNMNVSAERDAQLIKHIQSQLYKIDDRQEVVPVGELEATLKDIKLPPFLEEHWKSQIPIWTHNALKAILYMDAGVAYHKNEQQNRNIKIDAENTGLLQERTHLSDGLQQFLSMKENAVMAPISLTTSFKTIADFFEKYDSIFGLTGTLGGEETKKFLEGNYDVETMEIESHFKHCVAEEWKGKKNYPQQNNYRCFEYSPLIVNNEEAWVKAILTSAEQQISINRPVLVFVESPSILKETFEPSFHEMNERLGGRLNIQSYHATQELNKKKLSGNDIVLATTIAGRGIDFKSDDEVKKVGGIHICITFMPSSKRLEMQCIGRTSRSGDKGSGQMILYDIQNRSMEDIKDERDALNASQVESSQLIVEQNELAEALSKDFHEFLSETIFESIYELEVKNKKSIFLHSGKKVKSSYFLRSRLHLIEQEWAFWMKEKCFNENKVSLSPDKIKAQHEELLQSFRNDELSFDHDIFLAKEASILLQNKNATISNVMQKLTNLFEAAEFEELVEDKRDSRHSAMATYYYAAYCVKKGEPNKMVLECLERAILLITTEILCVLNEIINSLAVEQLICQQYIVIKSAFDTIISKAKSFIDHVEKEEASGKKVKIEVETNQLNTILLGNVDEDMGETLMAKNIVKNSAKSYCRAFGLNDAVLFFSTSRVYSSASRNRVHRKFNELVLSRVRFLFNKVPLIGRLKKSNRRRVNLQLNVNGVYYNLLLPSDDSGVSNKPSLKARLDIYLTALGYQTSKLQLSRTVYIEECTKGGIQRRYNESVDATEVQPIELYEKFIEENKTEVKAFEDKVNDCENELKSVIKQAEANINEFIQGIKQIENCLDSIDDFFIFLFRLDVSEEGDKYETQLRGALLDTFNRRDSDLASMQDISTLTEDLSNFLKTESMKITDERQVKRQSDEMEEEVKKRLIKFKQRIVNDCVEHFRSIEENEVERVKEKLNERKSEVFKEVTKQIEEMLVNDRKVKDTLSSCPCCNELIPLYDRLTYLGKGFNVILVFVHYPVRTKVFIPFKSTEASSAERVIYKRESKEQKWRIRDKEGSCLLKLMLECFHKFDKNKLLNSLDNLIESKSVPTQEEEVFVSNNNLFGPWYSMNLTKNEEEWKVSKYTDPSSDQLILGEHKKLRGLHAA